MPPEKKSELEQFLEGVNDEHPLQAAPEAKPEPEAAPQEEKPKEGEEEGDAEGAQPRKNRQHRRWEARLSERERELIAKEARLQAMDELRTKRPDADVDNRLLRLYGDNENGRLAAQLHAEMLEDVRRQAKEDALNEFKSNQEAAAREQSHFESLIDDELDSLEQSFDVDLTSDSPAARKARRELLELVERLSPKDAEGNIREYADFNSTYELYRDSRKKEPNTRAKELADRSMTQGGQQPTQQSAADAERAWLRRNGINV